MLSRKRTRPNQSQQQTAAAMLLCRELTVAQRGRRC